MIRYLPVSTVFDCQISSLFTAAWSAFRVRAIVPTGVRYGEHHPSCTRAGIVVLFPCGRWEREAEVD